MCLGSGQGKGENENGMEHVPSSPKMSVTGNSLQSRSGSRVIESWQNVLVYLPPHEPLPNNIHSVAQYRGEADASPEYL